MRTSFNGKGKSWTQEAAWRGSLVAAFPGEHWSLRTRDQRREQRTGRKTKSERDTWRGSQNRKVKVVCFLVLFGVWPFLPQTGG